MLKRCRSKQSTTLREKLTAFAKEVREKADMMPPGREREDMLKKVRQAETASHLDDWVGQLAGTTAPAEGDEGLEK